MSFNIKKIEAEIYYVDPIDIIKGKDINGNTKSYMTKGLSGNSTDLIREITTDDNSFVACSYSCSSENVGEDSAKCGQSGSNFSVIYYNAEKANNWKIRTATFASPIFIIAEGAAGGAYIKAPLTDPDIILYTWTQVGNIIPSGGIYYENPTGTSKDENWLNTDAYNNLKNSLECPRYMYYDHTIEYNFGHVTNPELIKELNDYLARQAKDASKNSMELCFANETYKCKDRDQGDLTKFGKANELSYSLTADLNNLLNKATIELEAYDPASILNKSFEKEEDICNALGNKMYDELTPVDTYEAILNDIFRSNADETSPNKSLYKTQQLTKLLVPGKSKNKDINIKYGSESLTDKYIYLKKIYINRLIDSVDYHAKRCHIDRKTIENAKITQMIDNKIDKIVLDYGKLDYGELNCDTLFSGVADIIKYAYFILEITAIIIIIISTVLDYSKIFLSDEQDAIKKANQKLIKRIIVLIVLLLLPALVNLFLRLFNIEGFNSENPLCIEIKNK
jgi:hypothetical protein